MKREQPEQIQQPAPPRWKKLFKRAGIAGLLFFLVKGLVWVGLFVAIQLNLCTGENT